MSQWSNYAFLWKPTSLGFDSLHPSSQTVLIVAMQDKKWLLAGIFNRCAVENACCLLTAPVEFRFPAAAASRSPAHLTRNPAAHLFQLLGGKKSPRCDLTLGFKTHSQGFSQSIDHVYLFTLARARGHVWQTAREFPQSVDLMPTPR